MTRRSRRARLLRASAVPVGVVLVAVVVLGVEAAYAAQRTYLTGESAPALGGSYGRSGEAPLRMVILGDSTAAGVGASGPAATVAVRLAEALAARTGRRVELSSVAVSGARAGDLLAQADAALGVVPPDLAVVLIGANDATHATRVGHVRRDVGAAVRRLVGAGVEVVVGTCPDLGAIRAFPRPLRDLVAWRGRAVEEATREAATSARARIVDLAEETGAAFRADAATLSSDEFHPSDRGYALWADALAPVVVELATRE